MSTYANQERRRQACFILELTQPAPYPTPATHHKSHGMDDINRERKRESKRETFFKRGKQTYLTILGCQFHLRHQPQLSPQMRALAAEFDIVPDVGDRMNR